MDWGRGGGLFAVAFEIQSENNKNLYDKNNNKFIHKENYIKTCSLVADVQNNDHYICTSRDKNSADSYQGEI